MDKQQERLSRAVTVALEDVRDLSADNKAIITKHIDEFLTYEQEWLYPGDGDKVDLSVKELDIPNTAPVVYDAVLSMTDAELETATARAIRALIAITTASINVSLTKSNVYTTFGNELLVAGFDKINQTKAIEHRAMDLLQDYWDVFETTSQLSNEDKQSIVLYSEGALLSYMIANTRQDIAYLFWTKPKEIINLFFDAYNHYKDKLPKNVVNEFIEYVTTRYMTILDNAKAKINDKYLAYPYPELLNPVINKLKQALVEGRFIINTEKVRSAPNRSGATSSYKLTYKTINLSMADLETILNKAKAANIRTPISNQGFINRLLSPSTTQYPEIDLATGSYANYQEAIVDQLDIKDTVERNSSHTVITLGVNIDLLKVTRQEGTTLITFDVLDKIDYA